MAEKLVPTLRVGMPSSTLRVVRSRQKAAERLGRHSHAERGNESDSPKMILVPRIGKKIISCQISRSACGIICGGVPAIDLARLPSSWGKPIMTTASSNSDSSVPELLGRFEQELLAAPDPQAVLERFQSLHPEMAESFRELAEAVQMLQETPFRPAAETTSTGGESTSPARFGPYRVIRAIGRGGMGEVYEADEEPLARRVAVKTIRRSQSAGATTMLRFDRERRTLARLHHTNVVPIFATGCEGDLLYFAMPYLSGASLGQVIKTALSHGSSGSPLSSSSFEQLLQEAHSRSQSASEKTEPPVAPPPQAAASAEGQATSAGPPGRAASSVSAGGNGLPVLSKTYIRTAVAVMAAVAEGVHHANEAGIIHRDLKPSNIMVETSGHAWVLDFGLASLKKAAYEDVPGPLAFAIPAEPDASLTAGPIGTPPYMAPEQHRDGAQADARTDVWGLGVTLYELLTLQRAFATERSVLEDEPKSPRQLNPHLDRDLEAVVVKALRKDPVHRYATAQALTDDLNRWLRHEPVSARPAPAVRRLWLWSQRRPGAAAAVGTAAAALVALGVGGVFLGKSVASTARAETRAVRAELNATVERQIDGILRDHVQGWSQTVWQLMARLERKPEERPALQAQAVATLSGLDARTDREFPIYAQALAFAPDGRLRIGHTGEGSKLWDPETDRLETQALEVDGPLAVRQDGTAWQLGPTYTRPDRPGRIPLDPRPNPGYPLRLLDVDGQVIARTFDDPMEGGSRLLAWSLAPQGSHAAAALVDREGRQHLVIWDAGTGRVLRRIARRNSPELPAFPGAGLAFAPDSKLLASWDGSGRIDLWSVPNGQSVANFMARNPVNCVVFGPNHWLRDAARTAADHWMLAAGDTDGFITLWNPGTQGAWAVLRARTSNVLSLAFSPDGTLLASAGRSYTGQLWDVATGRHLVEFITGDYATVLAFSPDGIRLVNSGFTPGLSPPKTFVHQLEPGRGIRQLHGLPGAVGKGVFSRDGRWVAALSGDWWAGVWARDTGRLLRLCPVPRGQFADNADLVFSPDGRRLAVSAGNTATLWDLETGTARRWTLPWGLTEALAFAGPDRLLLMRSEVRDGSRSPDSEAPATEYPRVCVLRDLLGPTPTKPLKVMDDFNRHIQDIEAAPDGSCFVVEGISGPGKPNLRRLVRAYDPDGKFLTEFTTQRRADDPSAYGVLRFDPTGKLFILDLTRFGRRQVLLEMPSGRFLGDVPVTARGVSPGARRFAVVDNASKLHLHDHAGNRLVEQLSESISSLTVTFSPDLDGRYLLFGNSSGSASVADLVEVQRRLAEIGLGW